MSLEDLRRRIDVANAAILAHFHDRLHIVRQIAEEKKARGLPIRDRAREEAVLLRAREIAKATGGVVDPNAAEKLLRTVIDLSVTAVGETRVPGSSQPWAGIPISGAGLGRGEEFVALIAGPCSVESDVQLSEVAHRSLGFRWNANGVRFAHLRGGAYKPRTSPNGFRGRGSQALLELRRVADEFKMFAVSECLSEDQVSEAVELCDVIQIGSRNGQNYALIESLARATARYGKDRAILLKRGFGSTVAEWIGAAEYGLDLGANVVLCERGIRTFENSTRATLDLGGALVARLSSRLPVVVDVSHSAGRRDLIAPLARAVVAAGFDGLMLETTGDPDSARSDADQQITPEDLGRLMNYLDSIRRVLDAKEGFE